MVARVTMSPKRTGRPKKGSGERGTKHVRVFEDAAEMIGWIVRIEGGSSATLLDPMIRAQLAARYLKHKDVIDKIRAAEEAAQKAVDEAINEAEKKPGKRKPGG